MMTERERKRKQLEGLKPLKPWGSDKFRAPSVMPHAKDYDRKKLKEKTRRELSEELRRAALELISHQHPD